MALQTTYTRYMTEGAAGAPATSHTWDGDTWVAKASAEIPFGYAVSKDSSGDNICVKGGNGFVGVAVRDLTLVHDTPDQYEEYDNVVAMVRGDIWVVVEDAVTAYAVVKYNATTGQLGSDGGVTIAGAYWRTSASAGGLAIVRLATGEIDTTT